MILRKSLVALLDKNSAKGVCVVTKGITCLLEDVDDEEERRSLRLRVETFEIADSKIRSG